MNEEIKTDTVGSKLLNQRNQKQQQNQNINIQKTESLFTKEEKKSMQQTVVRHVVPWYFYACDSNQVNAYLEGEAHHHSETAINLKSTSVQNLLLETTGNAFRGSVGLKKTKSKLTIEELIASSPSIQDGYNLKRNGDLEMVAGGFGGGFGGIGGHGMSRIDQLLQNSPSVLQSSSSKS